MSEISIAIVIDFKTAIVGKQVVLHPSPHFFRPRYATRHTILEITYKHLKPR